MGRRGDRALMLTAAVFCAVSLGYALLAFRAFDGESRGLDFICSVPKASQVPSILSKAFESDDKFVRLTSSKRPARRE